MAIKILNGKTPGAKIKGKDGKPVEAKKVAEEAAKEDAKEKAEAKKEGRYRTSGTKPKAKTESK
jgi:hypothetical protein